MAGWLLEVQRVDGPAEVAVGMAFHVTAPTVVGRAPGVDWVLGEARVSRKHARFEPGDTLTLTPLTDKPVWVNQVAVTEPTALASGDWVQLGGILLRAWPDTTATAPSTGPMTVADGPPPLAVDATQARLLGTSLALRPGPFRLLQALAAQASEWVDTESLAAAIWEDETENPAYVPKYVSEVRAAMRPVIEAEPDRIRALITEAADTWTDRDGLHDMDAAALARELIKARKKVGYRLQLLKRHIR